MIEINFRGSNIFSFKDENLIQILGKNEELKRLVIDIYLKIFNGYKFSDIDMEAMKGFYPEIIRENEILKKNDMSVIRISNIEDIFKELQINKGSVLLEYILSLSNDLSIVSTLDKFEESLLRLSIELDKQIEKDISSENLSIETEFSGIDFKKIITSFIKINFITDNNLRKPLWLLEEIELLDLFLDVIKLLINNKKSITLIIDGLDIRLDVKEYNYFIREINLLSEENSNFKVWLLPKSENGILVDYNVFNNTYIFNKEIMPMGDFDEAYESICRNYPDNNLPSRQKVLFSLLKLLPFYNEDNIYHFSKEVVILQIFFKLLDWEPMNVENKGLSKLETNFLTSIQG